MLASARYAFHLRLIVRFAAVQPKFMQDPSCCQLGFVRVSLASDISQRSPSILVDYTYQLAPVPFGHSGRHSWSWGIFRGASFEKPLPDVVHWRSRRLKYFCHIFLLNPHQAYFDYPFPQTSTVSFLDGFWCHFEGFWESFVRRENRRCGGKELSWEKIRPILVGYCTTATPNRARRGSTREFAQHWVDLLPH